ncbi:CMRF35-like molecule 9 [Chanodichthys erythropterus]|uniref:CMRF35-like molecule 9 n=1 Tax=Chanodichthys erythropterus TaxID=933992 RepID=UPI00351EF7A2
MRDLQDKDTGSYWCAVEIEGIFQVDETEQLHLTVQSAPDVSVVSSSVSGHEGCNVSVQCFYTSRYQNELKQWCRYKDQSCYTVGRTDTSQRSSVQISDDGRRSFTVLMTGLRLSDSGWFFCSVGDQQASVQLTVTVPDISLGDPHVPVSVTEPKPAVVTTEAFERNGHYGYLEVWISVVVLLLLMVAVVVSAIILRNKHITDRSNTHITEMIRDGVSDAGNAFSSSSVVAENHVTYSSVTIRPKTKASSPVSVEDEVTYSSVNNQCTLLRKYEHNCTELELFPCIITNAKQKISQYR